MREVSYGIDLSGRSRDGSRVARAERVGEGKVVVELRASALGNPDLSPNELRDAFAREVGGWEPKANVVVDVPIDLQELGQPANRRRIRQFWQLAKRPVDHALCALPPLADRIGATVALWEFVSPFAADDLGRRLFESYPAGSLRAAGFPHKGYKVVKVTDRKKASAIATMIGKAWKVRLAPQPKQHSMARILNGMGLRAPEGTTLSHDDVDAILCALTGLPGEHVLDGKELVSWVSSVADKDWIDNGPFAMPLGYRLLRRPLPYPIEVRGAAHVAAPAATPPGGMLCPLGCGHPFANGLLGIDMHIKHKCPRVPPEIIGVAARWAWYKARRE